MNVILKVWVILWMLMLKIDINFFEIKKTICL